MKLSILKQATWEEATIEIIRHLLGLLSLSDSAKSFRSCGFQQFSACHCYMNNHTWPAWVLFANISKKRGKPSWKSFSSASNVRSKVANGKWSSRTLKMWSQAKIAAPILDMMRWQSRDPSSTGHSGVSMDQNGETQQKQREISRPSLRSLIWFLGGLEICSNVVSCQFCSCHQGTRRLLLLWQQASFLVQVKQTGSTPQETSTWQTVAWKTQQNLYKKVHLQDFQTLLLKHWRMVKSEHWCSYFSCKNILDQIPEKKIQSMPMAPEYENCLLKFGDLKIRLKKAQTGLEDTTWNPWISLISHWKGRFGTRNKRDNKGKLSQKILKFVNLWMDQI